MTIKEIIYFIREQELIPEQLRTEASKQAIEEYRNFLYEHYMEKYTRYKDNDIENMDEVYELTIKTLCNNYINGYYSINIHDYISSTLNRITKRGDWDLTYSYIKPSPIKDLVEKARAGDKKAKQELIENYMYLVKIDDSMSEDDIQNGYLILTQMIDAFINNFSTPYVSVFLNDDFVSRFETLCKTEYKKQEDFYNLYDLYTQQELAKTDDFESARGLLEIEDVIDNLNQKDSLKEILFEIIDGKTPSEIAAERNLSRQRIDQRIKSPQIKRQLSPYLKR